MSSCLKSSNARTKILNSNVLQRHRNAKLLNVFSTLVNLSLASENLAHSHNAILFQLYIVPYG